ncbi:MAG: Cna B-type domain-containing protein [Oscillospiraceae bacterium]|nr:Cna B-type domain-containing protein [Oscillospiraceae bacterium]
MKRWKAIVLAAACLLPLVSGAARALELTNLTIVMRDGGKALGGISVAVCQVAAAREENGEIAYEAAPAFVGAEADFTELTERKNIELAAALDSYAYAHSIQRSVKSTGGDGKASFAGLPAGLYLVAQTNSESSEYSIAPYLVTVPFMNEKLRTWEYNITSYPKTAPTKRGKMTAVKAYKAWVGTDSPPAGGILVQLYRDGVPYGNCVTLNAGNHWSYTWAGLDPDGPWTVDEFDVAEGYAKKLSGSASTGFVITNTRDPNAPQKVLVSGKKTWAHGDNPISRRPKSILLRVSANGVFILQKEIGEAEHWHWSIQMDKYDRNGKEIVYTVDEAPVEGYQKAVDGYSLINIHSSVTSGTSGKPGLPSSRPETGDRSSLALWLAVMGFSLAGLIAVTIFLARRRRRLP